MIDKLKDAIIRFLQQQETAYLSLSTPDGPWAALVRYISDDLTLYLNEMRASDLVFYIENDPAVVLTVAKTGSELASGPLENSVQIFGRAHVLTSEELKACPAQVQSAFAEKNRQLPGVYAVIKIAPLRIDRFALENGVCRREMLDVQEVARHE